MVKKSDANSTAETPGRRGKAGTGFTGLTGLKTAKENNPKNPVNPVSTRSKPSALVDNSKFYDVLLPVEQIFAAMFRDAGFKDVSIKTLRKRTSKKELYEYLVSAEK